MRIRLFKLCLATVFSALVLMLVYAVADEPKDEGMKETPDVLPPSDTSDRDPIAEAIEAGDDYFVIDKNRRLYFYHVKHKSAETLKTYLDLLGPKPRKSFAHGKSTLNMPSISNKTKKADQTADTLIIEDTPENLEEIKKTLRLIDVPKTQVFIKSRIAEINNSDEFHYGFDFDIDRSAITKAFFNAFDFNYSPDAFLSTQATGASTFQGMTFTFESIGFSLKEFGVSDLAVRLLSVIGNAEIITSPQLLIEEGEMGEIYSGESFYVSSVSESSSGSFNVKTTAKQIGIKMDIYPVTIGDNYVKFRLVPSISDIIGYTTSSAIDGSVPILSTREIDTLVTVPNEKTLMLGGLTVDESKFVTRGIPVISDIPLIGEFFKSHDTSKSSSYIMFLITPSIINTTVDSFDGN